MAVTAGARDGTGFVTCGIRQGGDSQYCRGDADLMPPAEISRMRFKSIDAGDADVCGVREDQRVICWGDSFGTGYPFGEDHYVDVNVGRFLCALREDGVAECASWAGSPDYPPPAHERFVQLSVGFGSACGLRDDGYVICWGAFGESRPAPELDGFTFVTMEAGRPCGLRSEGEIFCLFRDGPWSPEQRRSAKDISGGKEQICALLDDGRVSCLFYNEERPEHDNPPEGRFLSISSSYVHTCGLREDGIIVCWGDNRDGQSRPPLR